jgi:hypothetical protein
MLSPKRAVDCSGGSGNLFFGQKIRENRQLFISFM